ncbi:hypothetical protein AAGR22_06935 [Erwinia sp. HDF1-3R]|uniref:hypothetical protein n=1 Tax=Erwinia sp. HDF1-3R TaxID=3141543 RepID=UPI0031F51852
MIDISNPAISISSQIISALFITTISANGGFMPSVRTVKPAHVRHFPFSAPDKPEKKLTSGATAQTLLPDRQQKKNYSNNKKVFQNEKQAP